MNTRIKRLSVLNYYGGKSRYLDWLLPLLNVPHTGYLEPYIGSGTVFLNKPQSEIEVINDLDGRLINFFKVLRDHPDEFIGRLQLTPYSRGEFIAALETSDDPIENARQFFVRSFQSFAGICDIKSRKYSWRAATQETRKGVALEISKWFDKIDGLHHCIDRLLHAMLENRPAVELVERYKVYPEFLIYLDPPYLAEVRWKGQNKDYLFEMTLEEHVALWYAVQDSAARIAVSHYDCETYDILYKGWYKYEAPTRKTNLGKKNPKREILWTNYQVTQQLKLY